MILYILCMDHGFINIHTQRLSAASRAMAEILSSFVGSCKRGPMAQSRGWDGSFHPRALPAVQVLPLQPFCETLITDLQSTSVAPQHCCRCRKVWILPLLFTSYSEHMHHRASTEQNYISKSLRDSCRKVAVCLKIAILALNSYIYKSDNIHWEGSTWGQPFQQKTGTHKQTHKQTISK